MAQIPIDDAPETIPMQTPLDDLDPPPASDRFGDRIEDRAGHRVAVADPIAEVGPHCPACGFRVFNRRYPKCESCGAELPPDIAYSDAERHRLMAAEEAIALEVARQSRGGPTSGAVPLDDAIVTAIVETTGR